MAEKTYIFASPSETLNHRAGQSHGEWSFWAAVGASHWLARLVWSHIDSVIPREDLLDERRKAEASRGED